MLWEKHRGLQAWMDPCIGTVTVILTGQVDSIALFSRQSRSNLAERISTGRTDPLTRPRTGILLIAISA